MCIEFMIHTNIVNGWFWASYHKKANTEVCKSNSHLQFYVFRWFSNQLEQASYRIVLSLSILFKSFCCALDCSLCILFILILIRYQKSNIDIQPQLIQPTSVHTLPNYNPINVPICPKPYHCSSATELSLQRQLTPPLFVVPFGYDIWLLLIASFTLLSTHFFVSL
jgi:hypothetical protein